jgi:hypothetical protein
MSNVNPLSLGVHALGDDQNHPLREQLGIIKAELTALEEAGGNVSDLAARVTALESDMTAVEARLTALETAQPPAGA